MGGRFVNREKELDFLEQEYARPGSSLVVIYGRRRIGKTALIKQFIQKKPALYYLVAEEGERENLQGFKQLLAEITGNALLTRDFSFTWEDLFKILKERQAKEKTIVVIDEFQYLSKANPSIPSVFQRIWDNLLQEENVMLILCGSLIRMMESQTLAYSSPLYGRRTGQIKLKQIGYADYSKFFEGKKERELVEYYAVTGGVPKYIELFDSKEGIFPAIEKNILNRQSFLYEEPIFLMEREVGEIGTYFSIIKAIAAGNHKLSKIAAVLNVSQNKLTRYLQTLVDLDLIERIVPVTEKDPSRSKKGLYFITDNFIEFWFKFVYPNRNYIEMDDTPFVMEKIKKNFIDQHVGFVFEKVCLQKMWLKNKENELPFKLQKMGRWWDKSTEIDILGLNEDEKAVLFGECKYLNKMVGVEVFYQLVEKAKQVPWNLGDRREYYIIFSKSGFSKKLSDLAAERKDLQLISLS